MRFTREGDGDGSTEDHRDRDGTSRGRRVIPMSTSGWLGSGSRRTSAMSWLLSPSSAMKMTAKLSRTSTPSHISTARAPSPPRTRSSLAIRVPSPACPQPSRSSTPSPASNSREVGSDLFGGFRLSYDAFVVRRIKAAGLIPSEGRLRIRYRSCDGATALRSHAQSLESQPYAGRLVGRRGGGSGRGHPCRSRMAGMAAARSASPRPAAAWRAQTQPWASPPAPDAVECS